MNNVCRITRYSVGITNSRKEINHNICSPYIIDNTTLIGWNTQLHFRKTLSRKFLTNSKLYLNILFYKEFVTLTMNFTMCNFNIHYNHVNAVFIMIAFYFVYRLFINILS